MSHATIHITQFQQCAGICQECEEACQLLIPHCLEIGGKHAGASHIGMLIDCAALCGLTRGFIHRESSLYAEVCRACATVCEACAIDCESFIEDDHHMMACADACRRCATWCHSLALD